MANIDERYKQGQIYIIRNIENDEQRYVGSTIDTLAKRFYGHKKACRLCKTNITLYKYIIDNDWSNWYIELYEDYPCNNKKELERREGEIIRELGTINKNMNYHYTDPEIIRISSLNPCEVRSELKNKSVEFRLNYDKYKRYIRNTKYHNEKGEINNAKRRDKRRDKVA